MGLAAFCNSNYDPTFSASETDHQTGDPSYDLITKALNSIEDSSSDNYKKTNQDSPEFYPNPANSIVWVNLPENFASTDDELKINVTNMSGNLLSEKRSTYISGKERIEVGNLLSGQYAVEIINLTTGRRSVSIITKQ